MLEKLAFGIISGLAVAIIMQRWNEANDTDAIASEVPLSAIGEDEAATETMV